MEDAGTNLAVWAPVLILAVITAVMVVRDPRRMRCAIFTALTLTSAYLLLQPYLFQWLRWLGPEVGSWYALGLVFLAIVVIAGVSVFLIWSGVVLLAKEGVSMAHSLSLALGLAIVGYIVLTVVAAVSGDNQLVAYLLMLIGPIFTFGFTLFAYLVYSGAYGLWARHWARPGEVVVVLGSGIIGERVPPLLARRLDLGVQMYDKSRRVWDSPVMVVSGGKGSDEQIPEAEAMARYLATLPKTQPGGELILEDQSVSTEQNLAFTKTIVTERRIDGPWMVVTSDFHAFRAAMLLSKQGTRGNAVGARSARYFWPSAKLREFIAILAANRKWTITAAAFSFLPLVLMIVAQLSP